MAKQVWQSNSGRVFSSKVEAEKEDVLLNALCELKRHNKYM